MRRFLKLRWVVTLILGVSLIGLWGFASGDSRSFQMAKNLDIFNSIVKELDLFYVDTIDPNKTVREGIDAMLYSLDPYTEYYPEDDQDELEQMLKNSYGGIGSVITYSRKTQYTTISEPYGIAPCTTFTVYPQGYDSSRIDEDVLSWSTAWYFDGIPDKLDTPIIVNDSHKESFYGES